MCGCMVWYIGHVMRNGHERLALRRFVGLSLREKNGVDFDKCAFWGMSWKWDVKYTMCIWSVYTSWIYVWELIWQLVVDGI